MINYLLKGLAEARAEEKICVKLEAEMNDDLKGNFIQDIPDHHILNIAYITMKQNPDRQVILVSKDVNLRMKAKAVGLTAQDYRKDKVKSVSALYKGKGYN